MNNIFLIVLLNLHFLIICSDNEKTIVEEKTYIENNISALNNLQSEKHKECGQLYKKIIQLINYQNENPENKIKEFKKNTKIYLLNEIKLSYKSNRENIAKNLDQYTKLIFSPEINNLKEKYIRRLTTTTLQSMLLNYLEEEYIKTKNEGTDKIFKKESEKIFNFLS